MQHDLSLFPDAANANLLLRRIHEATNRPCLGVDTEVMFPNEADHAGITEAKTICARCPVLDVCREFAMATRQQWGVWGGMSEDDRRNLELEQRNAHRRAVYRERASSCCHESDAPTLLDLIGVS